MSMCCICSVDFRASSATGKIFKSAAEAIESRNEENSDKSPNFFGVFLPAFFS